MLCAHLFLAAVRCPMMNLSCQPSQSTRQTTILARSQHVASGGVRLTITQIPLGGIEKKILISPTYMGNLSFKVPYKSPYNFAFARGPPPRGKAIIGTLILIGEHILRVCVIFVSILSLCSLMTANFRNVKI